MGANLSHKTLRTMISNYRNPSESTPKPETFEVRPQTFGWFKESPSEARKCRKH